MATFNNYYTQSGGNDANDGKDNIGVGLTTATWTEASRTLTQNGHGYTFSTGDVIGITGGTGVVNTGTYQVESSTANTIVLTATATIPGCRDADDLAAGDLGTGDITSSDGPWLTVDKCMNNVTTDGNGRYWIRNDKTYQELATIDTAGTGTQPIIFEGYGTTPGDGGQFTIDGQSPTRANGILYSGSAVIYYVFINMRITNVSDDGFDCLNGDVVAFINCRFDNCGNIGCRSDTYTTLIDCQLDNNSYGCSLDQFAGILGCSIYTNDTYGAFFQHGVVFGSVFYNNTNDSIHMSATVNRWVINCTIDGEADANDGIDYSSTSATAQYPSTINSIIYDCGSGIDTGVNLFQIAQYNLMNDNTNDYVGSTTGNLNGWNVLSDNNQTGAPAFTNEASDDYTLQSGSPAKAAGIDAGTVVNAASYMDIGAHQREEAAAGDTIIVQSVKKVR